MLCRREAVVINGLVQTLEGEDRIHLLLAVDSENVPGILPYSAELGGGSDQVGTNGEVS